MRKIQSEATMRAAIGELQNENFSFKCNVKIYFFRSSIAALIIASA